MCFRNALYLFLLTLFALATTLGAAESYYISANGKDASERNGLTEETAWGSLPYACERVPEGKNTIRCGPGEFIVTRPALPKSGVTIVGMMEKNKRLTHIVASLDWKFLPNPLEGDSSGEYLIDIKKANGVAIRNLVLRSLPEHRITGAVRCRGSESITFENLHVQEFRWAGIDLEDSRKLKVLHNLFENASMEKHRYHNGALRSRWISDSEIAWNRITSDEGKGYGYKASGHRNVRIHHNVIDVRCEFSIESAHENEFGVEIDHNYLTRCISIPKGGQGADPTKEGYEYSFWIHHNYLTDSYTIEGPRNHLKVSHNYIHIDKVGGRVYTQHGGKNNGPVMIYQNVIENVDRAFVWMNQGLAENIQMVNNTIFCADAGSRTGALLDAYSGERLNNWVFKNNIVIAAWTQSRPFAPTQRGVPEKITATHNLFLNVTGAHEGNFEGQDPGLRCEGAKPWPFYVPKNAESFVVDKGVDVGLPFQGKAPDLGACELNVEWLLEDIPKIR